MKSGNRILDGDYIMGTTPARFLIQDLCPSGL